MQQQNQHVLSTHPQPEVAGDQLRPLDPTALWLRQAPTAAFDALLDQADPQAGAPVSPEARANRRLCGRWLAVQRSRLEVSSGVVAERAGVDEPTLLLIEFGLADETQVPDSIMERLSYLLAGTKHGQGWVLDLLSIALGRSHAREAQVLQRVAADLSAPGIDPTALGQQDDGYELFRRAIVERDADAWAEIHTRYRTLLIAWVQRCSAAAHIGEDPADLADQALARVWAALSPERFAQFPSLAALLAYLRACVITVVIDAARAQAGRERMPPVSQSAVLASPEQIVLVDLDHAELWCTVAAQTASLAERVILIESFIYNLPPRAILARHPKIFVDVAAVYAAKRNLLTRLQRSPELLQLQREWRSCS